ncbi:MAG: hypothetical protein UZ13_01059 [Chloroflexi bacterium OLB13]|nr:MAG: hypothetical protein UZ13_01059 [Chloroflexi bacterium OLB13]
MLRRRAETLTAVRRSFPVPEHARLPACLAGLGRRALLGCDLPMPDQPTTSAL